MIKRLSLILAGWAIGIAGGRASAAEPTTAPALPAPRPNVLWISCEDTAPWLGFCGETYARTPNLDRLAQEGVYYRHAFATAPVCSPSRFAIITGQYATSMGTQRLRSRFPIPGTLTGFPAAMRQAGYYCTNNEKTDYNTSAAPRLTRQSWDESSPRAHWRNRQPGQPFFAVFNLSETHQSKMFESAPGPRLEPSERHDPAAAPVPPFYPDTPGARRTIARVHDAMTAMDHHAGRILAELEQDGLKDDTIVVFWADHGPGIPRGKRTLWDTGLQVPLVVRFPKKYQHLAPSAPGTTSDRLVSLIDLGPTTLSLIGLPVPKETAGAPFLASDAAPRQYIYGARDRVDEAIDVSRAVRDDRYLYIRNYMPDLSWLPPESFSDQLQFRRELSQLASAGKLNAEQLTLAGPNKPAEALYDTQSDPWQLNNLASDPARAAVLNRMRTALAQWQRQTRDVGMIHEWQADRMCAGGKPLAEAAATDAAYPLERVLDTAGRVGTPGQVGELATRLADTDPTVRYWAAIGLRVAGAAGEDLVPARPALLKAMDDPSMPVQIESAGVLAARWSDAAALQRLAGILTAGDALAADHAARTLEMLGEKARPVLAQMREAEPDAGLLARFSLGAAIHKLSPDDTLPERPAKSRRRRPAAQPTDD